MAPSVMPIGRMRFTPLITEACVFCQTRAITISIRHIHSSTRRPQQQQQVQRPQTKSHTQTTPSSQPSQLPRLSQPVQTVPPLKPSRPHVRARDGELVPKPLTRPLGLPHPPQAGQNTGADPRTWSERKADFANYDKHLERRRELIKDLYEKNYFRDLGNVGKVHKGKSMLAPATPFRKEIARWFPNLRGRMLNGVEGDTTDVVRGKVTVIKLISTDWADIQCESFVGKEQNKELWEYMEEPGVKETAQLVEINIEPNPLKYWLVRLFMGRLRRLKGEAQWKRYFLVKDGFDDNIKDALGVWNGMIGYVYLLDPQCKVRWAGNGDAREDERENVVKCLRRLVDEARGVQRTKVSRQEPRPIASKSIKDADEELEQQAIAAGAS